MELKERLEKLWFGLHQTIGELEELRDEVEVIQQNLMMEDLEKDNK